MSLLIQFGVNGIIAGAIYALVAAGFSLIYSTNRFMHLAHGSVVVAGGYFFFVLISVLKIPWIWCVLISIFLSGLLGLLLYRLLYLPLQRRKASSVVLLVASIALLIIMQNLFQIIFGPEVKSFQLHSIVYTVGGARISLIQLIIVGVALSSFSLLTLFLKKTLMGREIRAVADNPELASIVGIDTVKIASFSFLIGSALAGIAGIAIGLDQNISPTMGTPAVIKGFTGAVIGGLENIPASVVGSFLLGMAENIGIAFLPSAYKDAIAFVILFIFLLAKPTGLLGRKKA